MSQIESLSAGENRAGRLRRALRLRLEQAMQAGGVLVAPGIYDGYGGVVGVRRTVEEFEAAGVAAIHIEDQLSPKRCAQLPGAREVLPFRAAVAKIEAAGAGAVFVEIKGHAGILDDLRRVADAVTIPCMVNIDAGGPLAQLHTGEMRGHGITLAIYPSLLRSAVGFAMREALQHLRQDGSTEAVRPRMLTCREYNDCLGLPEVELWERRFPDA